MTMTFKDALIAHLQGQVVEVPAPEKEAPADGTEYFVPDIFGDDMCECNYWYGDKLDNMWLERDLVYLDQESAIARQGHADHSGGEVMEKEYAFPQAMQAGDVAQAAGGLTLRDYFAAQAMQGMLAASENYPTPELANYAYQVADAMLAERAKGGEQ